MTNESDSFIQEVDEGVRQDRMLIMMKRYGPYLAGVFVVFLLAIGGWQVWRHQSEQAAQRQSDAFEAALQIAAGGDLPGAKAAFERLTTEGPKIYRTMARMEHAALLEAEGDLQGAITEFDAIGESANNDVLRDSARLRAAYLIADTQDFTALQARLQPIIDSGGRMSFLAEELLAVEAWEAGQTDLARETLENLQLAFDAPETVRRRAQIALAVMGPAPAGAAEAPAPAREPAEGESK